MKKVITMTVLLTIMTSTVIVPYCTLSKTIPVYYHIKNIPNHRKIKRLAQSIHCLSRLHAHHYRYKACHIIEHTNSIQMGTAIFSNRIICDCLKKTIQTESLRPIIILLQYAQETLDIQHDHFVCELFILIFTVHKQILFNECIEHHHPIKKNTLEAIIAISNVINQLPIAEILNAIDMLVTELPPFIEKYELNTKIGWKAWLKKYWWVPPIFGAWFGLKILFKLQRPFYFYSPYFSPRPQIQLDQPVIIIEPTEVTDPVLSELKKNG